MRWALLLAAACGALPEGKGPLRGDFDQLERRAEVGAEVRVTLLVQAAADLPGGHLRLAVPAGLALRAGDAEQSLAPWTAGERRTFAWTVGVTAPGPHALLSRADADVPGEIVGQAWATVFNPGPPEGREIGTPEGEVRHVESLGGSR